MVRGVNVADLGDYIRKQRTTARLTLKSVAGRAGVSIPYLSQVERGLRRPSAEILQAIAKGLRISAETLYVQAGILDQRPVPDVAAAIMGAPTITERQKQALIQIYRAFSEETEGRASLKGARTRPGRPKRAVRRPPSPRRTAVTSRRKEV